MNIPAYVESIERTGRNLPGVLADWENLDEDLRSHYGDSLIEVIMTHAEAEGVGEHSMQAERLRRAWDSFVPVMVAHASAIASLMGVSVFELLAPSNVTVGPCSETQPCRADTVSLDLAQGQFLLAA
jgi:hypothetical protein